MKYGSIFGGAALVLGAAGTSSAQLTIVSAERSVYSDVSWTALMQGDSETVSDGPITTFGQWDAIADADPDDVVDWHNQVITEQHSFIGSGAITADLSTSFSSWPFRPSLGYITLESRNVFNVSFTVAGAIPVDIDLVCDTYSSTGVQFEYQMQRTGGGFVYFGNNYQDYSPYGTVHGFSFDGILQPGTYTLTTSAHYLVDGQPIAVTPRTWDATFDLAIVPAPGTIALAGFAGVLGLRRQHR